MEVIKRTVILKAIISKGGLIGSCAKLCFSDEVRGSQFIIECSEQCHTRLANEYFGKELVSDIIEYSNNINNKRSLINN